MNTDVDGYNEYFRRLNEQIKNTSPGIPGLICDLERLDRNIETVSASLTPGTSLRLVTKSLPSIPLLRYILLKTASRKLMCFHLPFLPMILKEFDRDVDILIGKPFSYRAVRSFFKEQNEPKRRAEKIQWLVDSLEKLKEYHSISREFRLCLRINIEIDTGLHRGGVESTESLRSLLDFVKNNSGDLRFSGFMGYEGHVSHVPRIPGTGERPVVNALKLCSRKYRMFKELLKSKYPELAGSDLTFNSGGSGTFRYYTTDNTINDISVGGAFLRPAGYPEESMSGLLPAFFIAAPVIKKLEGDVFPFYPFLKRFITMLNPETVNTYSVYGGGWAGEIISPAGMTILSFLNDPPNQNLLPNQSLVHSVRGVSLNIDDNVFYQPMQGDAMFPFQSIVLFRDGERCGNWDTFPMGF